LETPGAAIIESELIGRLKARDESVLDVLYRQYAVSLFAVVMRILKDEALAEDVLQEALMKIWRYSATYSHDKGSLYTWMVSICRNAAIDKTRSKLYKQMQQANRALESVAEQKGVHADAETDNAMLRDTMNQLPEKQRVLVDMAFFQGYTHVEIAERLNIPLGTVKTRIRLAIKLLRAQLS